VLAQLSGSLVGLEHTKAKNAALTFGHHRRKSSLIACGIKEPVEHRFSRTPGISLQFAAGKTVDLRRHHICCQLFAR
jgi:hypothetical protein